MAWLILFIAGIFEIVWTYTMKQSDGFTRLLPTALTFFTMLISFVLLSQAMRTLPMGTAYMVWAGIGAVGTFIVGIVVLGEHATLMRVMAATMIAGGIVLMKLGTPSA